MLLSVFNPVVADMDLDEALGYLKALKVDAMELGIGGCSGTAHASAVKMAKDKNELDRVKGLFEKHNIKISALSVHGNGVHPNQKIADSDTRDFEAAVDVASKLGVERVITFSGCPGDGTSKFPNWVTCAWPTDFLDVLNYQWDKVLIPYWKKEAKIAEDAGVKVCFEMHPGFCVYNVETMLKIRNIIGDTLGANLDPSHLLWQGCDTVSVIKALGKAIYFFHAKDTMFNKSVSDINGVLDVKPYTKESERSWIFRTVGYGCANWKDIITALRMVGYDHAISVEHEDSLMPSKEGLEKAVNFLQEIMIKDGEKTQAWWT